MLYLIYATLAAWLVMVIVNNRSHKKYIAANREKFLNILNDNFEKRGNIKVSDSVFFSFTPDNIEKREFTRYLNLGKLKYIASDTAQIMFSVILIFVLVYSLEYLPFIMTDNSYIDFSLLLKLLLAGYLICVADVYSKTLKYDKIIEDWRKDHPDAV
jgi:predicted small secreted protein